MDPRKARLRELAHLCRLDPAGVAAVVGKSLFAVRSWHQASADRYPPAEVLDRLERHYLDQLRAEARAAGYELIRLRK